MNEHLRSFNNYNKKAPLMIDLAGITYPDMDYYISRKKAEFFVIEYVTDGYGYVLYDGEMHRVSKDTVYILFEGERHEYYSDKSAPFTKIFLNVKGSLCKQLLIEYGILNKHYFDGSGLKPLFERIIEIIDSGNNEQEMHAALEGIFIEIISILSARLTNGRHSEEALKMKNYIDSNLDRQVSAEELSAVLFRSKDYCQKLFLGEFGITPYAYAIARRMEIAKSYLANTNMSVGEIAAAVGYGDIHYFSNLFLKKCGQRPLGYRKSKR